MYRSLCLIYIWAVFSCTLCMAQDSLRLIAKMHGERFGDGFGVVAAAGDVSGDGFDDILVGAKGIDSGNYAKLYLGGVPFDTVAARTFRCEQIASHFGFALAGNGDLNGDGYPDIVIGAPRWWRGGKPFGETDVGRVYVYFGGPTMDTIPDLLLAPETWYAYFGSSVAIVGDVNGDGYDDFVVGAPLAAWGSPAGQTGRAYLYLGGNPMDTLPVAMLSGYNAGDFFGESVSVTGDVNGDGYADFLIGAGQRSAGYAMLYFGGQNVTNLSSLTLRGDSSAHAQFGKIVSGLGDLNSDGFTDFGVFAENRISIFLGGAFVDTMAALQLNRARVEGDLSALGDINGDGYDDFATVDTVVRVFLGGVILDTIPVITPNWASGFVRGIGDVHGDGRSEISHAPAAGYTPYAGVSLYSLSRTDAVEDDAREDHGEPFFLSQNHPNPFNGQTTIEFRIDRASPAYLELFSVIGQRVAELYSGWIESGMHRVVFDASSISSGLYFYRLTSVGGTLTKKMLIVR